MHTYLQGGRCSDPQTSNAPKDQRTVLTGLFRAIIAIYKIKIAMAKPAITYLVKCKILSII